MIKEKNLVSQFVRKTTDQMGNDMQLNLFAGDADWRPPDISSLPEWSKFDRICIDIETRDDDLRELGPGVRRGAYIVGFAFSLWLDRPVFTAYLPYRHSGGDNLPEENVLKYITYNAGHFKGDVVGANLKYDLDFLWEKGIFFDNASFYRDIQIADPLIYELHYSYSLKNIGKRYGIKSKDEEILINAARDFCIDPKSDLWKLPARYVGKYAETDTITPLLILERQEEIIRKKDLKKIWDLESRFLPVLLRMQRRGVKIDFDKLEKIEKISLHEEKKALDEVKRESGIDIGFGNFMKASSIVPALDACGIKVGKTATGKPNIDRNLFRKFDHPVLRAIERGRRFNKYRNDFSASIRKFAIGDRLYCTYNQIAQQSENGVKGVRYGRLSSDRPNLQNQPSRDDFAKTWRSIFIPDDEKIWGSLDYSQQEPRWTTYFSSIIGCHGAEEALQKYINDPSTDNHTMMAELTGLPRKQAKSIFLGLCYGEGGAKMCRELGLETRWAVLCDGKKIQYFRNKHDAFAFRYQNHGNARIWETAGEDGQDILHKFDDRAPYIRHLSRIVQKKAADRGYIRTIFGRTLNFHMSDDGKYEFTHKALNRLIQGSSADQMKLALIMIDEQFPDESIQLQVHDELNGSFSDKKKAHEIAEVMEECVQNVRIPFKVDVEIGPSWGELI